MSTFVGRVILAGRRQLWTRTGMSKLRLLRGQSAVCADSVPVGCYPLTVALAMKTRQGCCVFASSGTASALKRSL